MPDRNLPCYAILSSTQRTGSTLVQRILATEADTFIWGEAGDFLQAFLDIEEHAILHANDSATVRAHYLRSKSLDLIPNDYLARIQNLTPYRSTVVRSTTTALSEFLRTMYGHPNYSRIGFKCVKVTGPQAKLCARALPLAKIFLVVREPAATYRSIPVDWRVTSGLTAESFASHWTATTLDFIELAESDSAYRLIEYDDLIQEGRSFDSLLSAGSLKLDDARAALHLKLNSTPAENPFSSIDREIIELGCESAVAALRKHLAR